VPRGAGSARCGRASCTVPAITPQGTSLHKPRIRVKNISQSLTDGSGQLRVLAGKQRRTLQPATPPSPRLRRAPSGSHCNVNANVPSQLQHMLSGNTLPRDARLPRPPTPTSAVPGPRDANSLNRRPSNAMMCVYPTWVGGASEERERREHNPLAAAPSFPPGWAGRTASCRFPASVLHYRRPWYAAGDARGHLPPNLVAAGPAGSQTACLTRLRVEHRATRPRGGSGSLEAPC